MHLSRVSVASVLLLLAVAVVSGLTPDPAVDLRPAATVGALPSDFNGDGVEDRAIGVPADTTDQWYYSGAVHIVYGLGPDGTKPANQYFTTRSPFMKRLMKMYPTRLGAQIASGDFDHDGYADLAMSVPGYDEPDEVNMRINVGGVVVVYGTAHGLDPNAAQDAQIWSQDTPGVQGVSEDDDYFGSALAVGDFDGDRYLDLAVGIEGEQTGPDAKNSGAITVLYGGRAGLTARDQEVDQDTRGILDSSETGDWAGDALAAGDFNGDAVDDLALGVFSEGIDGKPNAGAVNVIYGTSDVGLTGRGDRFVNQGLDSIAGVPRKNDLFGSTLAVGDYNGDNLDDLVIGAPEDTIGGVEDSGSTTFIPGSSSGLVLMRSKTFTLGDLEPGAGSARFGSAVAAGDVNGDGFDELAIGSAWYGARPGRVDVLAGSPDGPALADDQLLTPDQLGQPELVAGSENFGSTLQFGAFDASPGADLLVGLVRATLRVDGTTTGQAGAVVQVFSRSGRLDPVEHRLFYQGAPGVGGTPTEWETFGAALPGSADYFD
jgi:hypothetical protein